MASRQAATDWATSYGTFSAFLDSVILCGSAPRSAREEPIATRTTITST
jgi:hypothetical protein